MKNLLIVLVLAPSFGCKKDSPIPVTRIVTGTVFEDCNGTVSIGKKIYLTYAWFGCFGSGIISIDSTVTDCNGRFRIPYKEDQHGESTTNYEHALTIPNSTIILVNPKDNYDLYPNNTKMNAVIKLKFRKTPTWSGTFYYQFMPTYNGRIHDPQHGGYLTAPFHDTVLVLNDLMVGNVNSVDSGKYYSGFFKWGIGKDNLGRYYTGYDGYFNLTHQPCAQADTFVYYVDPI